MEKENQFMETLSVLAGRKLSREELNTVASEAMPFVKRILRAGRIRSAIRSTTIEEDEFVDDVVLHLLNHIDEIVSLRESERLAYIYTISLHKVIDKVRAYHRVYGTNRKKTGADRPEADCGETAAVLFLDETGWNLIPDTLDLAQRYEDHEMACLVLRTLAEHAKPLEVVSFLAIAVLGWKPRKLADRLMDCGTRAVLYEIVSSTANIFNLPPETFAAILSDRDVCVPFDIEDRKNFAVMLSKQCSYVKVKTRTLLRSEYED